MLSESTLLVFACLISFTICIPLPPLLPKEYGFYLEESGSDVSVDPDFPGIKPNPDYRIVAIKTYSLKHQANRGVVASISPNSAIKQDFSTITVTNYNDQVTGSMVAHLDTNVCNFTPPEGNAPYDGYDYAQQLVKQLGSAVRYSEDTNWIYNGKSYGPVQMWAVDLPYPVWGLMTHTLVFPNGSNLMLAQLQNGTEPLPFNGNQVKSYHTNNGIRSNYVIYPDDYVWPEGWFATICPFESDNNGSLTLKVSTFTGIVLAVAFASSIIAVAILLGFLKYKAKQGVTFNTNKAKLESSINKG